MATRSTPTVPTPTPETKRVAQDNYDRARQVVATGDHDYAISLLRTCCKLDPANFAYRKALRQAQKEKYNNNLRGSRFAFFSVPKLKARVKTAKAKRDYLSLIEAAENVLGKNPWDAGVQMDQAEAFDALGLLDLAVFTLNEARQKNPKDATVNRALARLFEKRGDFKQAIALWQMVKVADPRDVEAGHKAKDLAASETIAKGGYVEVAAGTRESPALGGSSTHSSPLDKLTRDASAIQTRLAANPGEPTLYIQLAQLYKKHQQNDRALATLQQGLGPTGNHPSLKIELLELELAPLRQNLVEVEKQLAKLKSDDDADPDQLDDIAEKRRSFHNQIVERELGVLRGRAEAAPHDLSPRLELGVKLIKADRIDEAIPELQLAKREERLKGRAAMYLGVCFRKRANWRLAQRNFEEALQLIPENDEAARKEVLYQLAVGSAEANEWQRALDHGNELANLDYGYKQIGGLLDTWQARLTGAS